MRNTLFFSCLILALLAAPSYAVVVEDINLGLLSGSSVNKINIVATVNSRMTSTDSAISTATGTLIGDLDYSFQGGNLANPTLESLDFNDGSFGLTNIHLDLQARVTYGFTVTADIDADTTNLSGIVRTTNPPALVTNGEFAANKQKATINSGTLTIDAGYDTILGHITLFTENTNFVTDPAWGTSSGNGSVTTTLSGISGYDYTYDVHLELPLTVIQNGTIIFDDDDTITYTLNASGLAVAEGTFTQTIIPGDANWDGKVDGSDVTILADNWQAGVPGGASGVTWTMGDFNGDYMVDGSDVTILADNWQYGVSAVAAPVPEPGTLALLLSATIAGLVFIRRRR